MLQGSVGFNAVLFLNSSGSETYKIEAHCDSQYLQFYVCELENDRFHPFKMAAIMTIRA